MHTQQLAAFHYHTDGHGPAAHNVAISASSGAPPQVYPAVTCSISAPHPSTAVQALVRYKRCSEQYH